MGMLLPSKGDEKEKAQKIASDYCN